VPFTSESKEAIASYPEIQKEIRLALQAVGRNLGMYLRRRLRVAQEGQRRSIFLRYLGEVAQAVSTINGTDAKKLYEDLLADGETTRPTPHPKLRIARARTVDDDAFRELQGWLRGRTPLSDDEVRRDLRRWVPEYGPGRVPDLKVVNTRD
jgi:hypothetical protein